MNTPLSSTESLILGAKAFKSALKDFLFLTLGAV
jgi:hypothetical protein